MSTPVGAALAAGMLVVAPLVAVWASGYWELFSQNRGLLQLVLVIPVSSLVAAFGLARLKLVTANGMLWAMAPVGLSILILTGVAGPGYRAWPWAVALSAALFVPWVVGLMLGRR